MKSLPAFSRSLFSRQAARIGAFGLLAAALTLTFPPSAHAWVRAGIYVGGPVYAGGYYPAYPAYAYPAYPAYPYPAYPPVAAYPAPAPAPSAPNYGPVYQAANGQQCREYTRTIYVDGQAQKGYGQACRQPDGSWQIVN